MDSNHATPRGATDHRSDDPSSDEETSIPMGPSPMLRPAMNAGPRRVMVVEDDEGIRDALCDLLAAEGYEVVPAFNGADALERLRSGVRPDVILLDLMMPVMDGWAFRAEQRRDPALAEIPVVVITASRNADVASLEPRAFLRKPIDFDELLKAIDA